MENGRDFSFFQTNRANKKETETGQENKELGEKLRKEFAGAVLRWMKTLDSGLSKFKPSMPRSRRLSAAFGPTLLFTTLIGCGDLKKIDCTSEESSFLQSSIDWIKAHPEEIEAEMAELWPNPSVSMKEIIASLETANIYCGERRDESSLTSGTAEDFNNTILIDISSTDFDLMLNQYETNNWVENANLDDIIEQVEISGDSNEIRDEIRDYYEAIGFISDKITHEATHLAKGHHSENAQEKIDKIEKEMAEDPYASVQLKSIDEIYAWGTAAYRAANFFGNDLTDLTYGY